MHAVSMEVYRYSVQPQAVALRPAWFVMDSRRDLRPSHTARFTKMSVRVLNEPRKCGIRDGWVLTHDLIMNFTLLYTGIAYSFENRSSKNSTSR